MNTINAVTNEADQQPDSDSKVPIAYGSYSSRRQPMGAFAMQKQGGASHLHRTHCGDALWILDRAALMAWQGRITESFSDRVWYRQISRWLVSDSV